MLRYFLAVVLLSVSLGAWAENAVNYLIIPKCMSGIKFDYSELGRFKNLILVQTADMTSLQLNLVKKSPQCRGFVNVTQSWKHYSKKRQANPQPFIANYLPSAHPGSGLHAYLVQHQNQVQPLLELISTNQMQANLNQLTAFRDRDANSETGIAAANWLIQQVKLLIDNDAEIELKTIATPGENSQPSIVVKLGKHLSGPGVVLGAHFDTLPSHREYKPGADDNASGVVTLLETLRVLTTSHTKLHKPVYLIWYAAKEQGVLGSQAVVNYFKQKNIPIIAALNLDKTGYEVKDNNGIGLIEDYTDISLTAFMADLVANYVNLTASEVHGGFASSDHLSWYQANVPVVYPYEVIDDAENPYALTRFDKTGSLSLAHMADFTKLAVAFAIELTL